MVDLGDVRTCGNIIKCMQNMLLTSELEEIELIEQKFKKKIEDNFQRYLNEIADIQSIGILKKPKPPRGKKKKEEPTFHPDAILEENEETEEAAAHTFVVPPSSAVDTNGTTVIGEPVVGNGAVDGNTTVSGRPRRAAVDAAAEKMKRMTEMSNTRKLRRPSDYNQNDHGNYNVYNSTKNEECFPRTKRRKGSTNETVITSSQFFHSSTLIHSSPLNKHSGLTCEKDKTLEMSIIPPHTETMMEYEEHCSIKTRTRTLRTVKTEEKIEEEEEEKSMEKKVKGKGQKENQVDNKQIAVSIDLTSDEDATLTTTKHKKKSKKVKEDSKEKMSASETCDSDSGVRTRTRVQKKAINKVEDLPVIASSPVKVISDKIKDKVNMFENVVNGTSEESEGRVTRTKTRKLNKSEEEQSKAQGGDVFKIPLAVKNVKEIKKPTIVVKKPADKTKEPPAVDPKQAAIDERRRLREERSQKAAAARDQAEKEKREHAAKLEREREEKLKLKKVRDDKLKEEMEKKKKEAMAKIEQQKREQEAARVARLQEIVEEENRKEAQRKKEQEMAERKVQQAKLADKLKAQQKLQAAQKKVETPVELNYSISEDPVPSDEDEEARPKRPIPSWAKASNRNVVLADQIYLSELIPKFFDNPDDINPSVIELFGEENVRSRPRTSSAVWNRTACE
uniref:Inner centromere protein n=1 Tax=Cacopsylla melanoneura TaxID=428564 RepID=A0A8D8QBP7_9HEMI